MPFFKNIFTSLRAITHEDAQASSGAGVPSQPLASLDDEFQQHGTDPEWTRREIARAEAQDAELLAQIQFNEENG